MDLYELLELIDELEDGCGGGAEKVKRRAQEALDISENEFEDIFRELREQRRVYEPVLGKIGWGGYNWCVEHRKRMLEVRNVSISRDIYNSVGV